uniref:Uncharacterized protein n=1 Tax=Candidatus Kentrum sp. SD TaxID=2126332 RepID=A0A450YIZ1_9GAMM|nr:MAG: hypothetical protein BECKSD772F_GA0070984_109311 [Candidatus Kentron sp. SD]VFK47583.1 MAG: hypothetical protein BECKSD772E_GA0070983_109811 [Candidatus Kentron sp. SD]VFK80288.1 MAG: hypothetical protein BECKSD772D_GA0070982_109910 [Candidatus Kentron sp. SD]
MPAMDQVVSHHHPSRFSNARVETFNSLVGYLIRLRHDGTLDDTDFRALVKMASAMFVEAEISGKVESIVDKALENVLPDILGWRLP